MVRLETDYCQTGLVAQRFACQDYKPEVTGSIPDMATFLNLDFVYRLTDKSLTLTGTYT